MIRLLIADDHPIVREGLKRIVAECPDMQVVGEATDGNEVLAKSKEGNADILLLDVAMPGPRFLDNMRHLRAEAQNLRILVLSIHPEDSYALQALRAGAAGYLTKDRSPQELAEAVRRIYQGRKYITSSLAEKLASELEQTQQEPHKVLSDREYEVFCLLGAGKSVKEIAFDLVLSAKTVSTYRARILEKMQLKSNAELIRYAIQKGLVE
ncbi:MAG: response regulator [Acidiferrobacterales bacterium]